MLRLRIFWATQACIPGWGGHWRQAVAGVATAVAAAAVAAGLMHLPLIKGFAVPPHHLPAVVIFVNDTGVLLSTLPMGCGPPRQARMMRPLVGGRERGVG